MALSRVLGYLAAASGAALAVDTDLTQYVLTDTGSIDGGNTFPGVSLPFGIVKLGPDLYTGSDSYSGYQPSGNFTGFSLLHESGTGGAPKYGVVSQLPVLGDIANPLEDHSITRASPDVTQVGYYKSSLANGITVELGATNKAGMLIHKFPSNGGTPGVIVDVSHVLPSFRGQGLGQNYLGGNISVTSQDNSLRYEGFGTYDNGWNRSPGWNVYFCGHFDAPASFKTFVGTDGTGSTLSQYDESSSVASTARLGAVFTFDAQEVTSRVGVSFVSIEGACANVDSEVPSGTSLSTLGDRARTTWNDIVLSKVTTTDTDVGLLRQLYSALYFMHLIPTNKTGENPLWTSSEPYYDDIFTLWDLHRCTTPLLHVLQPVAYEEYIRSLIDVWRNEGYMPDGRSSFFNGATQGGSNADIVLADAYVKGVRGNINWDDGYSAMLKDAQVTPEPNNDPRDTSSSTKEGRGALPDWIDRGYITTTYGRSVSRAVEYSANDFGLHQVASGLGKDSDAEKYLTRSRYWRNQWNPNLSALGFSGFLGPRDQNGFIDQDPLDCGGCYWADNYYQGLPWEYSFNAHHDINTIIGLAGGNERFVDRLEHTFIGGLNPSGDERFNKTIFNPGNEPSFTTPYLYNFAGRQDLSVKQSRYIAKSYYSATPGGLPGNSDAGAMESWLLWAMLGLYPMTGQTTFFIASPWFKDVSISLGGDKSLRITTTGGSDSAFYVQSLKVNGEQWTKNWVTWEDVFANGGTMDFVLGTDPVDWATGPAPPSPATDANSAAKVNGSNSIVGMPDGLTTISPSDLPVPPVEDSDAQVATHTSNTVVAVATSMSALGAIAIVGVALWFYRSRARKARTTVTEHGSAAERSNTSSLPWWKRGGKHQSQVNTVERKSTIV